MCAFGFVISSSIELLYFLIWIKPCYLAWFVNPWAVNMVAEATLPLLVQHIVLSKLLLANNIVYATQAFSLLWALSLSVSFGILLFSFHSVCSCCLCHSHLPITHCHSLSFNGILYPHHSLCESFQLFHIKKERLLFYSSNSAASSKFFNAQSWRLLIFLLLCHARCHSAQSRLQYQVCSFSPFISLTHKHSHKKSMQKTCSWSLTPSFLCCCIDLKPK